MIPIRTLTEVSSFLYRPGGARMIRRLLTKFMDEVNVVRKPPVIISASGYRYGPKPQTQTLAEQIATQLADQIVAGIYQPEQRILEQEIAAEFAVSRGPVRDALRILENQGLVTILPRRGAQITQLTVEEVYEIFDIRAALHGLRSRLLAEMPERMSLVAALERGVKQLVDCAGDPNRTEEYIDTSFMLSSLLTSHSKYPRLSAIIGSLASQTRRYSRLGLLTPERRKQSSENWKMLAKAIHTGDGLSAETIGRQLVLDSRDAAVYELRGRLENRG